MTGQVIAFPGPPSMTGEAVCCACRHTWTATVPLGSTWLACPACELPQGRLRYPVDSDGPHWHCACGNDLFRVKPDFLYCVSCGAAQVPDPY